MRICSLALLFTILSLSAVAQDKEKNHEFNIGLKAGFHALTYNDPDFRIDGYTFDSDCIHSNKIGYTVTPFLRATYKRFYLQTEAMFGVTRHSFDFKDTPRESNEEITPNSTVYNLKTYSLQIPILFGYNFVSQNKFGMSMFTGPRTKFIFTSRTNQEFKHFNDDSLEEVICKIVYYWEFGLGVKIDKVFFDFAYDLGLSDASKYIISRKTGNKYKSSRRDSVLSFSVGMIF